MAASILAKVTRDRLMGALHEQWPQYGFDAHKGYGTPGALGGAARAWPLPVHRRSFAPVRETLAAPVDAQPRRFSDRRNEFLTVGR